jgi:hypothetical protein
MYENNSERLSHSFPFSVPTTQRNTSSPFHLRLE